MRLNQALAMFEMVQARYDDDFDIKSNVSVIISQIDKVRKDPKTSLDEVRGRIAILLRRYRKCRHDLTGDIHHITPLLKKSAGA